MKAFLKQEQNITNKARELAEKYHIDLQQFKGKDIIREKDILPLIQTSEDKITRSKANDPICAVTATDAVGCIKVGTSVRKQLTVKKFVVFLFGRVIMRL